MFHALQAGAGFTPPAISLPNTGSTPANVPSPTPSPTDQWSAPSSLPPVSAANLADALFTSVATGSSPVGPPTATGSPSASPTSTPDVSLSNLPLAFEPNMGQGPAGTDFLAHGPGYNLSLAANQATLTLSQSPAGL